MIFIDQYNWDKEFVSEYWRLKFWQNIRIVSFKKKYKLSSDFKNNKFFQLNIFNA